VAERQEKKKSMKALTLYQPWATLVAVGAKRIETRSWSTKYRGPLAIHVSKNKSQLNIAMEEPFASTLESILVSISSVQPKHFGCHGQEKEYRILTENLHLGCVIATCELIDCRPTNQLDFETYRNDPRADPAWCMGNYAWIIDKREQAFGDYSPGRFMWFLANVKLLPEPIPARGAMGLWNWEYPQEDQS
jgi:hypothetical protein